MPVGEGWYGSLEVSEILKIHRTTVLSLIRDGLLSAFEISPRGDKRITREDLVEYMERRKMPLRFLERYEAARSKKRVLIIEDEKPFAARLAGAIAAEDRRIEVKVAHTAGEGALLMGQFRPHLVLLDFGLPDMKADQLLRSIEEPRKDLGAKIIMMSAKTKREIAPKGDLQQKMENLGVDEFICKDEKVKTIRDAVLSALGIRERRVTNSSK